MKKNKAILSAKLDRIDTGHYAGTITTDVFRPDKTLIRRFGPDEQQPDPKANTITLFDETYVIVFVNKVCKGCGEIKDVLDFYPGRHVCKSCFRSKQKKGDTSAYRAAYYQKNKEEEKRKNLERYYRNKKN